MKIKELIREIRKIILKQSFRAGVGHIGSALSIAEVIGVLYQKEGVLQIESPEDPERDRFILSKGHASLALYAGLFLRGWITKIELDSYCQDGSWLGVHPDHRIRGIEFSTGSLGQGITFAVGAALAARIQGSSRRVYCLISDAELNEGSTWEAIQFAAHQELDNLVVLVDWNGQQALGKTKEILDLDSIFHPFSRKMEAFGWWVRKRESDDKNGMKWMLENFRSSAIDLSRPQMLVVRTVSGKGVSWMEGKVEWHYRTLIKEQFDSAMEEVEKDD